MKKNDISGNVYGNLVAIRKVRTDARSCASIWLFRCDCGNEKEIEARTVTAGRTRTCGKCKYFERLRAFGGRKAGAVTSAENRLFQRAIQRAQNRGLHWGLDQAKFLELSRLPCHLCGTQPSIQNRKKNLQYNKVEPMRIESGYTVDGCFTVCKHCDSVFSKVSISLVLERIVAVYKYLYLK